MILVSSCCCLWPIHWSQVLSREWRCSWSSADRRCSNYIWVIDNFIAFSCASYIRGLTVCDTRSRWLNEQWWQEQVKFINKCEAHWNMNLLQTFSRNFETQTIDSGNLLGMCRLKKKKWRLKLHGMLKLEQSKYHRTCFDKSLVSIIYSYFSILIRYKKYHFSLFDLQISKNAILMMMRTRDT